MSCQHILCTYIANSLIVIEMKQELHRGKKGNTCTLLIDVIFYLGTEKMKRMLRTVMDNFIILLKQKEGKEFN